MGMEKEGEYDVVVIGGGIVGLAITKHLSEVGQAVLLIEKEEKVGQGTSSRSDPKFALAELAKITNNNTSGMPLLSYKNCAHFYNPSPFWSHESPDLQELRNPYISPFALQQRNHPHSLLSCLQGFTTHPEHCAPSCASPAST
jgi:choline dehydrogenase-like flavoprotein